MIACWILLLQEFNYKVVVKSGKANSSADYMSRQRGPEASSTIETSLPDEFPDEDPENFPDEVVHVFHHSGEEPSEYEDVIGYIRGKVYPLGLSREKKMVF